MINKVAVKLNPLITTFLIQKIELGNLGRCVRVSNLKHLRKFLLIY